MIQRKTIKLGILSCDEVSKEEMNERLRSIRYHTCQAANRIVQLAYLRELERLEYKKQNGIYPDDKKQFGVTYGSYIERLIKEQMPIESTNNIAQTKQGILSRFKKELQELLSYKKSLPNYKLDIPIFIHNKKYVIQKSSKGLEIKTTLYNKNEEIKTLTFRLQRISQSKKNIVEHIMQKVYKQGGAQIIQDKKKKWYIILSYSFDAQPEALNANRILGIDLGIVNVMAMQVWDAEEKAWEKMHPKDLFIDGYELIHLRQKEKRREYLRRSLSVTGNSKKGHGKQKKLEYVGDITTKIRNLKESINHKYSRHIISTALKYRCGIIHMENLVQINPEIPFLHNWNYYDLQNKIERKATEVGIVVHYISPFSTSKRCSKCGYTAKENRINQKLFSCLACGHEEIADLNAAKNIALTNIKADSPA